jgi:hypothetical protein
MSRRGTGGGGVVGRALYQTAVPHQKTGLPILCNFLWWKSRELQTHTPNDGIGRTKDPGNKCTQISLSLHTRLRTGHTGEVSPDIAVVIDDWLTCMSVWTKKSRLNERLNHLETGPRSFHYAPAFLKVLPR